MATEMDVLVIDSCILRKEEQPAGDAQERQQYHASFGRD
jgi:hypothetical protein